jgi:hypothetical protein
MGREARGVCTIAGQTEPMKALLESAEIILKGETLKRRIGLSSLHDLRVDGGSLCFNASGERVSLALGADEAQKWLRKILAPPPSLAGKLGVGSQARAFVLGAADDAALIAALDNANTSQADEAAVLLTIAMHVRDLQAALTQHAGMRCKHLWVVHEKGAKAALGDTVIRQVMRERNYTDNKSCAVSARYTATRYGRPG